MPSSTATTATTASSPTKKTAEWVAAIYDPTKLPSAQDPMRVIVGGGNEPVQCFPIMIGLPAEEVSSIKPKDKDDDNRPKKESRSVRFSPGVTMGVNFADYETALIHSANLERLVKLGVVSIVVPEDESIQGYRGFSEEDALKLVSYSYAPELIRDWLEGENRPVVLKVANEHRQKLDEELERRAAA